MSIIYRILLTTVLGSIPLLANDSSPCRSDAFMDLTNTPGAGEGYARPRVEASCEEDALVVSSNAIPHYEFIQITPNPLVENEFEFRIPLQPALVEEPSAIPLLGTVGVAINGIPIFGPNEGAVPPPGWGDPVYNSILDACQGHTAREYHYHALVESCFATAGSPVLGFAMDGFAIYGPAECADAECTETIQLESSWERIADPTHFAWEAHEYRPKEGAQYLDRCNGHSHGGEYHYHATVGFPYVLGCFSGTPLMAGGGGGGRPGGGPPGMGPPPGGGPGGGAQGAGEPSGLVTDLRSVRNALMVESTPALVARGGILNIFGEGFATEEAVAGGYPLPAALGDPSVQVYVNGVAAPLFLVSPEQINAQVPWGTEPGPATVVVSRDGTESMEMPVTVEAAHVSFARGDGTRGGIWASNGQLAVDSALTPEAVVTVFATGLGLSDPAVPDGAVADAGVEYSLLRAQTAIFNGISASVIAGAPSSEQVGFFDLQFEVPERAGTSGVLRWLSGDAGGSVFLGQLGIPTPRYMAVPLAADAAARIDMTDLNPYFVALSGELDSARNCYPGAQLLDLRRNRLTEVHDCLLPTVPASPGPGADLGPFVVPQDSALLAALPAPLVESGNGAAEQVLLIDSDFDRTDRIPFEGGVSRLEPGSLIASRSLRVQQAGGSPNTDRFVEVDLDGSTLAEGQVHGPLPVPLAVEGRMRAVAQNDTNIDGYRLRFLGPDDGTDPAPPIAALFGPSGALVATADFPGGWLPIALPDSARAASIAPATTGFGGRGEVFVVVRRADGTRDGVAAFTFDMLASAKISEYAGVSAEMPVLTATATEFPMGAYAATCGPTVQWHRSAIARRLIIAGAGEAHDTYADPREGATCGSDRVLVFDPQELAVEQFMVPRAGRLDVAIQGEAAGYVYFGDADREVALEPTPRIFVFDAATSRFAGIDLPAGDDDTVVGLPFDNWLTHAVASRDSRIVALATSGMAATDDQGNPVAPAPGNEGLLVVDLAARTSGILPLPEGYDRIVPGNRQLIDEGRPLFGLNQLVGRAWALVTDGDQPHGGNSVVTWDVYTGAPTPVAMPPGAISAARPAGVDGSQSDMPFLWDYQQNAAAFAFGVYGAGDQLIAIGVVGP